MIDWEPIVAASIPTAPALVAVLLGYLNRRAIRTPSGDNLGAVAERTHDISHATNALLTSLNGELHGRPDAPDG